MNSKQLIPFAKFNRTEASVVTLAVFLSICEMQRPVIQMNLEAYDSLSGNVSQSAIQRQCVLLEDYGLITRQLNPDNKRQKLIELTNIGKDMYLQLTQID